MQIAKEFGRDDTVLIAVIHDINLAIQYADSLFFLKSGELIAYGKPIEILGESLLKKVFDVSTTIIKNSCYRQSSRNLSITNTILITRIEDFLNSSS